MPQHATGRGPAPRGPLRAARAAGPAGVESQPGYDQEDVVAAGVNGNPTARTAFAVMAEAAGGDGGIQKAGGTQDERGGARTIVGGVKLGGRMARAVNVGEAGDAIGGGNRNLDIGRSGGRSDGIAVTQDGGATRDVMVNVRRRAGAAGEEEKQEKNSKFEIRNSKPESRTGAPT